MGFEWGDTGTGPGFSGYAGPNAFKVTEPKPKGDKWPELMNTAEAEAKAAAEAEAEGGAQEQ